MCARRTFIGGFDLDFGTDECDRNKLLYKSSSSSETPLSSSANSFCNTIKMTAKGTILVTGTNGGLGSALVQNITTNPKLASEYKGLYTARKVATATALNAAVAKAAKTHEYETFDLELASVDGVRKFCDTINERVAKGELPKIRALILNAGYQEHETLVSLAFEIIC